jgi:hypothetical protein
MKRCLLVLFALLLPLQLAWANVADFCGDAHAIAHVLQHADEHDHESGDGDGSQPGVECSHCHGHTTPMPTSWSLKADAVEPADAPLLPEPHASAPPGPRPERPQWSCLA